MSDFHRFSLASRVPGKDCHIIRDFSNCRMEQSSYMHMYCTVVLTSSEAPLLLAFYQSPLSALFDVGKKTFFCQLFFYTLKKSTDFFQRAKKKELAVETGNEATLLPQSSSLPNTIFGCDTLHHNYFFCHETISISTDTDSTNRSSH